MPGYVIADVEVSDMAAYHAYMEAGGATIAQHGGKFLVRGGPAAVLEGSWQPRRLVVIEFPSVAVAQKWWDSEAYQHARTLRLPVAKFHAVLIQGAVPTA
jgi:uncharacterized protein (DUF1330 family)